MDGIIRNLKEKNLELQNTLLKLKIEEMEAARMGMPIDIYKLYCRDMKKFKDEVMKKLAEL